MQADKFLQWDVYHRQRKRKITGMMQPDKIPWDVYRRQRKRKKRKAKMFKHGTEILYVVHRKIGGALKRHEDRFPLNAPLSFDELLNLYYATDGFCEYSGRAFDNTTMGQPSPDRIDSSKGYVEGNVAWVRWGVNKAKQDMPLSAFREVCLDVATARLGSGRAAVWERVRSLDTLS